MKIYPIDSHPSDGRAKLDTVFPTITEKIKKGSADGPLLLIVNDDKNVQAIVKPLQ
jgi:hypothetical protein